LQSAAFAFEKREKAGMLIEMPPLNKGGSMPEQL